MRWFENPSIDYSVVSAGRRDEIQQRLGRLTDSGGLPERWHRVSKSVLTSSDPFLLHRDLFRENYREWDSRLGPPPAVMPEQAVVSGSNLGAWMKELGFRSYSEFHEFSVNHPGEFAARAVEKLDIRIQQSCDQVLDLSNGPEHASWFVGARMNIVDSIVGTDNDADLERTAIVFQCEASPADEVPKRWSLGQLKALSGRIANGLSGLGLSPGDAVAIDMPMTADCVAIYLGIVRAGMCVVSVADSFAPREIATRLRISNAKAIFTQDVIVRGGKTFPLYEKVVEAKAPAAVVLPARESCQARLRDTDVLFDRFLSRTEEFSAVGREPTDAINVLFSSGTTGEPKAIPWDHTTPVRCALDGFVHQDIQSGDVVAWPTNVGWMMGPWLIFATLINKGCVALYDGMPQTREFGIFVQSAEVNVLGVVPSLVKAWRNSRCMEGIDWRAIKVFSSTGESSSSEDMLFLMSLAGYKPVIEYCGGTEVGGSYVSSTVIQPNSLSCFSAKTVGMDFRILGEEGEESDSGEVYLVPPAIGLSSRLLNGDHHEVYFEGCPTGPNGEVLRRHGDEMQSLPGMYFRALGRADDTMNLGGIKVSSVELERVMNQTEGVTETAAIAVPPLEGGASRLVVYVVADIARRRDRTDLKADLQAQVRKDLNPLFKIADVVLVDALPRTASNKVMRRVLRTQYEASQIVG